RVVRFASLCGDQADQAKRNEEPPIARGRRRPTVMNYLWSDCSWVAQCCATENCFSFSCSIILSGVVEGPLSSLDSRCRLREFSPRSWQYKWNSPSGFV